MSTPLQSRILQLVAFFAISASATGVLAQISEYITQSVPRSPTYHSQNYNTFRIKTLRAIGGVLSQMDRLHFGDDETVPAQFRLEIPEGTYPGYICVMLDTYCKTYDLQYEALVPIALFVDSGGTSMYTAWEVDDSFRREAGFTDSQYGYGNLVALEFAGTEFDEVLYYIDFCDICLTDERADLTAHVNFRLTQAA